MRGFEHHGWRHAGLKGLLPAAGAEAPTVARAKPREAAARRDEVVAAPLGEGQKVVGHAGADHMQAGVVGPRVAEAIAVKPGLMGRRAGL